MTALAGTHKKTTRPPSMRMRRVVRAQRANATAFDLSSTPKMLASPKLSMPLRSSSGRIDSVSEVIVVGVGRTARAWMSFSAAAARLVKCTH
jgi:hypothetical protein